MMTNPLHCPSQLAYQVAAITHPGSVRDHNEDAVWIGGTFLTGTMDDPHVHQVLGSHHLALVADGMGGHVSGEVASRAALKRIVDIWAETRDVHGLAAVIQSANDHIYDLMAKHPVNVGMGTTVVGTMFGEGVLILFNVGDSRAYRFAANALVQVSHDDTLKASSNAERPRSHMVTQSLGGRSVRTQVRPHVTGTQPLRVGEVILLCSDGLTDMVNDDVICNVIREATDAAMCVRRLLDLALTAGGQDNISIVVVWAM